MIVIEFVSPRFHSIKLQQKDYNRSNFVSMAQKKSTGGKETKIEEEVDD